MRTAYDSCQSVPDIFLWLPSFSWTRAQPLLRISWYAVFQSTVSLLVLQDMDTWRNKMFPLVCLGAGLLTFLWKGFLTTCWDMSLTLERWKSFQFLWVLLDPNNWDTVVSVSPGIPFCYFGQNNQVEKTERHPQCLSRQICVSSLQFPLVYKTRVSFWNGSRHFDSWEKDLLGVPMSY